MKNKWFVINEEGRTFESKRRAKTKNEAWDKTLLKWGWAKKQGEPKGLAGEGLTCGMCDIYINSPSCGACPLHKSKYGRENNIGTSGCIPFTDPDLQYLWLLFVREASK